MSKKRLGKGLGALIPEFNPKNENNNNFEGRKVIEIPLEKIQPNPNQPRKEFDRQKLLDMAQTILEFGLIQPILVTENNGIYTIIAGERRFRAAQLAGLKTISAEIREFTKEQYMEIALIENLQREDLNPIEEAIAYQRLIEEFNLTQDQIAKRLGKSRSAIANTMRLLSLPDNIKNDIITGKLTQGQVRPLLVLKNEKEQEQFAEKIINEKLTARQVENYIQQNKNSKERNIEKKPKNSANHSGNLRTDKHAILQDMEDKLRKIFGTKVLIKSGRKEGKIEFSFYNDDDLDRLLNLFLKQ